MSRSIPGRFLVLEGLDGSGKTTQLVRLAERLRGLGETVHETREPTAGPVGELLRRILKGEVPADPWTIAALFAADRLDHLSNARDGLKAKREAGVTILCDRYYFSSYAYHSAHVPLEWVLQLNAPCARTLRPDLSVFLDLPPEKCVSRLLSSRPQLELYENLENMRAVRDRFLAAFDRLRDDERVAVVDGDQDPDAVAGAIWREVAPLFPGAR